MLRHLALLLLISCGSPKEPALPAVESAPLKAAIERVEPLLLWCDGAVAFPRKNNITKQPMCDVGDSLSTTGAVLALGGIGDFSVIERSIEADGRAWRHPSYVGRDKSNSLSRDQYIGVLEATFATRNFGPLNRLEGYISRTGKLCPDATDNRCDVTPGVKLLSKFVRKAKFTALERELDENVMLTEAASSPAGYRVYLVARKLMLIYRTGNATGGYTKSVRLLYKRFPKSLYIRVLHSLYVGDSFNGSAKDLTACLNGWQKTGLDWFGDGMEVVCPAGSQGAELVALSKFILSKDR